jgi:hypothetical protein
MQNYRNNGMYRPMPAPVTPCEPAKDDDMVLAMAYVKWQKWQKIYDAEKALYHGTIFQELDMPFCGIGGCQK